MFRALVPLLCLACLLLPPQAYAGDDASPWPKVDLYTTDWCPYCIKAKAFFDQRQIPYTLYDIEKSREAAFKKERIAPGAGIPVVIIDGTIIRGYSKKAFLTALDLDE